MPVGPWKVLRERDFALIWVAGAVSDLGTWMQIGALGIFVTQSTGDSRWTGIAGTVTYVTAGLFAPVGGVLADRHERRHLLMAAFGVQAAFGAILTIGFATGVREPLALVALSGLQGALAAAIVPAMSAMIPDMVVRERLPNAAFLEQVSWNVGRAVGPALAIAVISAHSYSAVFALNAISFAAVALCMPLIRIRQVRQSEVGSTYHRLQSGWRGLRQSDVCFSATLVTLVDMAVISPFIALIPVMGQITLHGGPALSGALFVGQGIGSAVGAVVIGSVMHRVRQGRALVWLACAEPAVLLLYSVSPDVTAAIALITILGGLHTSVFSLCASLVQQHAPDTHRGRVVALNRSILIVGYGVASALIGVAAAVAGLRASLAAMALAAACCLVGLTRGSVNHLRFLSRFERAASPTGRGAVSA